MLRYAAVALAIGCGATSQGFSDAPEVIPGAPSLTASATNYYFSAAGNDSNDCLSTGTSCKTLAKIATWNWVAGSTINLNKGDTFSGTMYLFGGGTAGGSPPTFSGATFANVTAYGTGANPIINATGQNTGIRFDRNAATQAWKISNIDIKNAKIVGIDKTGATHSAHASGLWIDNVNISNITGANISTNIYTCANSNTLNPGYPRAFTARCVDVMFQDNMYVHTVTCDHSDMFIDYRAGDSAIFDGVTVSNTYREGLWISEAGNNEYPDCGANSGNASNVTVKNSHLTQIGTTGMWFGTSGLQLNGCTNCLIQDVEIDHVLRGTMNSNDGVGFDDEGYGGVNNTWSRVNVHDCEGPPVLHLTTAGGASSGTTIDSCTFLNNGTRPDTGTGNAPCAIRWDGSTGDAITFTNNDITRSNPSGTQFLYQTPIHGTLSDTPGSTWTVSGNTIH